MESVRNFELKSLAAALLLFASASGAAATSMLLDDGGSGHDAQAFAPLAAADVGAIFEVDLLGAGDAPAGSSGQTHGEIRSALSGSLDGLEPWSTEQLQYSLVPEPATAATLMGGLVLLTHAGRRRRQRQA